MVRNNWRRSSGARSSCSYHFPSRRATRRGQRSCGRKFLWTCCKPRFEARSANAETACNQRDCLLGPVISSAGTRCWNLPPSTRRVSGWRSTRRQLGSSFGSLSLAPGSRLFPYPPALQVMALTADDVEHVFSFDEGDIVHVDEFHNARRERGGSSTLLAQLGGDGTVHPVVVWLPHNCSVELLDIRADAQLSPSKQSGLR